MLHLSVPGAVAGLLEEREKIIYVLLLFNLSSTVTTIPVVGLLTLFTVFKLTEKSTAFERRKHKELQAL